MIPKRKNRENRGEEIIQANYPEPKTETAYKKPTQWLKINPREYQSL